MTKRKNFEDFMYELGLDPNDMDTAQVIYFTSIYTYDQKLSWRRQIVRINKLLEKIKNGNNENSEGI